MIMMFVLLSCMGFGRIGESRKKISSRYGPLKKSNVKSFDYMSTKLDPIIVYFKFGKDKKINAIGFFCYKFRKATAFSIAKKLGYDTVVTGKTPNTITFYKKNRRAVYVKKWMLIVYCETVKIFPVKVVISIIKKIKSGELK
jgi:hypothetical protein